MVSAGLLAVAPIPVGDHVRRPCFRPHLRRRHHLVQFDRLRRRLRARFVPAPTPSHRVCPTRSSFSGRCSSGGCRTRCEAGLGPRYRHVVPLAVTIFMLVLAANWVEIFPGLWHNTDYLPSPTADVNLTYALGATVFVLTNGAAIRAKGFGGYIKSFFAPAAVVGTDPRPRGAHEAGHPGAAALWEPLLGRDHDRAPVGDPDLLFPGDHRLQCGLEDVRPGSSVSSRRSFSLC